MSCLECKNSIRKNNRLECTYRLPLDLQDLDKPETCYEGEREENSFGKRFGMRDLLLSILQYNGKSLSEREHDEIKSQKSITELLISTIDLYEKKINSENIASTDIEERGVGRACFSCSFASTEEQYLTIQCSHYHNAINLKNRGCEQPKEWLSDHLIREQGLSNLFDLFLELESTLWLFLHDEWTAGEKWLLILSTYEQTLQEKRYQVVRPKKRRLQKQDKIKRIEDDIVY